MVRASTSTNSSEQFVVGLWKDRTPNPIWITIMIMRNDLRELLRHSTIHMNSNSFAIRILQSYSREVLLVFVIGHPSWNSDLLPSNPMSPRKEASLKSRMSCRWHLSFPFSRHPKLRSALAFRKSLLRSWYTCSDIHGMHLPNP